MKLLATLIILLASISVFGNDVSQIEKELVESIKNIWKVSNYGGNSEIDKQGEANKTFEEKLLKYTDKNLATLRYDFKELGKHMTISTSPDGKLRTYSWDRGTGGTMHFFSNVYQFIGGDGNVYAITDNNEEDSLGSRYTEIYNLKTRKGTVYLVIGNSKFSTSYAGQAINLFKIEGKNLNGDYQIFKTRSGLTSSIGFSYDFFSVVNRPERPLKLIRYNSKQKEVLIPVVIEDKKTPQGRVTNRFIKYRFNGKHFVKVRG